MNLVNLNFSFLRRFTQTIICGKSDYSYYKGRTFRYLNLDKVGHDALEGMALLEESRISKRAKEAEERAQRRAKGIMYDEENIGDGKVRFLYAGEFKHLYEVDREMWKLMKFILLAMAFGVIGFLYVKTDLTKRRRKVMLERKLRIAELRKIKEEQKVSKNLA